MSFRASHHNVVSLIHAGAVSKLCRHSHQAWQTYISLHRLLDVITSTQEARQLNNWTLISLVLNRTTLNGCRSYVHTPQASTFCFIRNEVCNGMAFVYIDVSLQLNFRLFVICHLDFGPFVGCQIK